jgi:hypothetical protein
MTRDVGQPAFGLAGDGGDGEVGMQDDHASGGGHHPSAVRHGEIVSAAVAQMGR